MWLAIDMPSRHRLRLRVRNPISADSSTGGTESAACNFTYLFWRGIVYTGSKRHHRHEWRIGMLTDIRISGYIRIINYQFNYPSTWRLIIFMYFLCSFRNFYGILQKFCTLIRVIQNISGWIERITTRNYTSATLCYPHLPAPLRIYDFIWLPCPFSKLI